MSLPVLSNPTYTAKVPSTGKNFNFRPFIVREQKILLMALESGDITNIYHGLRDIINSCILTDIGDVESIPLFDLEGIFLAIAAKSTGEIAKVGKKCKHCSHLNEIEIPLEGVVLKKFNKENNKIQLTDQVGVLLKYPTLKDALDISISQEKDKDKSSEALSFEIIMNTIGSVFEGKNVYSGTDYSKEDLAEFVESFQMSHLKKIKDFLINVPYLSYEGSFECESCKKTNEYEVKGIRDFFF
jgi:hypothetical protein